MSERTSNVFNESKLTVQLVDMVAHLWPDLGDALRRAESPIEQMFLMELANVCEHSAGVYFGEYGTKKYEQSHMANHLKPFDVDKVIVCTDDASFCVAQQHEIDLDGRTVRPDFSFLTMGIVTHGAPPMICARIAVELDGHNWHERSKEQAKADKSRDRALAAAGWHVLRFTGSEIYEDPARCVVECLSVAVSITGRKRGEIEASGVTPTRMLPNVPRCNEVGR